MDCKECNWLVINNYKFKDGSQTIECTKYSKLLGFTDSNGKIKDSNKLKKIIECAGYKAVNLKKKPRSKSPVPQSGVKNVNWTQRSKGWKVLVWLPNLKMYKHVCTEKDLEKAINIHTEALKNITKYEIEERDRLNSLR